MSRVLSSFLLFLRLPLALLTPILSDALVSGARNSSRSGSPSDLVRCGGRARSSWAYAGGSAIAVRKGRQIPVSLQIFRSSLSPSHDAIHDGLRIHTPKPPAPAHFFRAPLLIFACVLFPLPSFCLLVLGVFQNGFLDLLLDSNVGRIARPVHAGFQLSGTVHHCSRT
ncbi:hypothetical protein DFH07DRAFT_357647 [Mycena maculata]|uniref:Secreted protein n=1 Tax=Mycena maculata TaxID=230809 RepID=A0AAD7JM81_9AGAR|nr:hypothetical protein DFH07DRAFT_357647 [Mycena maculata]